MCVCVCIYIYIIYIYKIIELFTWLPGVILCYFCFPLKFAIKHVVIVQSLGCVQLFATPWTVTCQVPLSMGFPRQEYWSGLPFLSPRDLPDPGVEPAFPAFAGRFFTTSHLENPIRHEFCAI